MKSTYLLAGAGLAAYLAGAAQAGVLGGSGSVGGGLGGFNRSLSGTGAFNVQGQLGGLNARDRLDDIKNKAAATTGSAKDQATGHVAVAKDQVTQASGVAEQKAAALAQGANQEVASGSQAARGTLASTTAEARGAAQSIPGLAAAGAGTTPATAPAGTSQWDAGASGTLSGRLSRQPAGVSGDVVPRVEATRPPATAPSAGRSAPQLPAAKLNGSTDSMTSAGTHGATAAGSLDAQPNSPGSRAQASGDTTID